MGAGCPWGKAKTEEAREDVSVPADPPSQVSRQPPKQSDPRADPLQADDRSVSYETSSAPASSTKLSRTDQPQQAASRPIQINSLPFQYLVQTANGLLAGESLDPRQAARYRLIRKIGEGGFADVYLAEHQARREKVAIKFMDRGRDVRLVRREIMNHSTLVHPQVVRFKEVFIMAERVGLVMEYIPGGDLHQYIKRYGVLNEDQARWIFQQLTVAVDYCHRSGIINRDLKLENTLVLESSRPHERPLVKICDFGYSKYQEVDTMLVSKVGTPGYIAPEVLAGREQHGSPVDFWSLGCILYGMVYARYPFLDRQDEKDPSMQFAKTYHRVMKGEFQFPRSPAVSSECKALISQLLLVDPLQRAGLSDLLRDPWFLAQLPANAFPAEGEVPKGFRMHKRSSYQTHEEIMTVLNQAEV